MNCRGGFETRPYGRSWPRQWIKIGGSMDSPTRPTKILALTPAGAALARRLARGLKGAQCWLPEALAGDRGSNFFPAGRRLPGGF